jgi:hypothetical protein
MSWHSTSHATDDLLVCVEYLPRNAGKLGNPTNLNATVTAIAVQLVVTS